MNQSSSSRGKRRTKPKIVVQAIALLWTSYALSVIHVTMTLAYSWSRWSPVRVLPIQLGSLLFYAALIYFVSRGLNWARWTYLALFAARLVNVLLYLPQDLHTSKSLVALTGISFLCLFVAFYWLFTEPGRRWFWPSDRSSTVHEVLRS